MAERRAFQKKCPKGSRQPFGRIQWEQDLPWNTTIIAPTIRVLRRNLDFHCEFVCERAATVWAVTNHLEHPTTAVPHTAAMNVAMQCVVFEIENASIYGDAQRLDVSSAKRWPCGDGSNCRRRLRAFQAISLNRPGHAG